MADPKISIIIPVFNSDKFLKDSINSILNQSYKNIEILIVYDRSSDNTYNVLLNFLNNKNIKLLHGDGSGLVNALNIGLNNAEGEYIARMDADDISLPTRLEEQLEFLNKNNIDICGTSYEILYKNKIVGRWDGPQSNNDIKFALLFMSPFAHPSVMFRKKITNKFRYSNYKYAEDYRFWIDLAINGLKMGNINKPLLKYRHPQNSYLRQISLN